MSQALTFKKLRDEIIGRDFFFKTPYGDRLLTYADYTASGRSLKFVEKYLVQVQRQYANTHTEDDVTGRHMTGLLHHSEHIIKKAFNADQNCYVIATGTGSTGAISKTQEILGVRLPPASKRLLEHTINQAIGKDSAKQALVNEIKSDMNKFKPIVFVGPYEHHSNDIMWRQALNDVVEIKLSEDGYLDLHDLIAKLEDPKYAGREKIGSFSAASNVTGIKTPVYEVARILHEHDALAFFDFAASAPYVEINMNKDELSYFDGIFISPHKFIGGPGSTGILVFNKKIYDASIDPTFAAGGTVDFVSSYAVDFIEDVETREKPGTPGILQTIKAALAIDIKDSIGISNIEAKELEYTHRAFKFFNENPNIEILGPQDPDQRICIFSFLIKNQDKYLHPKFCTKLLNDLFGIQSRAGCSCAGVYGHHLMNINTQKSKKFRKVVQAGFLGIKPGWVRVNFHYAFSEDEFNFICDAIDFVATYGYLFLPDYSFDFKSGDWHHLNFIDKDLEVIPNTANILKMELSDCFDEEDVDRKNLFSEYMRLANEIARKKKKNLQFGTLKDKNAEEIRWFNFINIKSV
ncbi:aminotransferase class V-fold PLP-dependent enzyme [Candidatus Lokiarchaeum ossiferum]